MRAEPLRPRNSHPTALPGVRGNQSDRTDASLGALVMDPKPFKMNAFILKGALAAAAAGHLENKRTARRTLSETLRPRNSHQAALPGAH